MYSENNITKLPFCKAIRGLINKVQSKKKSTGILVNYVGPDIKQHVSKCQICEKFKKQNSKEPLMPHLIPNKPFEKFSFDILQFANQNYLAIIYYYSKRKEISILKDERKLKCNFARHGITNDVVCDNSPYNSYSFKKFVENRDFEVKFSSPRFS